MPLKRKILFHFLAPSSSYHPAVIFLCQSASCRISSSLAPRRPRPSGKSASVFFFQLPICQLLHTRNHMQTVSLPACQLLHTQNRMQTVSLPVCQLLRTLCRMLPVFPPVFLLLRMLCRMQMPVLLPFFCPIQTDSKVTYSVPPFLSSNDFPFAVLLYCRELPEKVRTNLLLSYLFITPGFNWHVTFKSDIIFPAKLLR